MIDEVLDGPEPLTNNNTDAVIMESVFLLVPAKGEGEFSARYLAALQRDPAVVLAHAQVAKRIPPGKPRATSTTARRGGLEAGAAARASS